MSRYQVVQLYNDIYLNALAVPMQWTGNLGTCDAGATSTAYAQATLDMVNYFRAMAGLPAEIVENATHSAMAQEAALMMYAEGNLSHSPGTAWTCYTADGATAAGKSNLALGAAGADAIDLYLEDPGSGNYFVGHRRWILYPRQTEMGTGSAGGTHGANALWVLTGFGSRPLNPPVVAWPPAGFVPYPVVYPRWSFSINLSPAQVDYSAASVTMSQDGSPISVTYPALRNDQGFADDTLVWTPAGIASGQGMADSTIAVEVRDVLVDGVLTDYSYQVTVIDPAINPCSVTESDLDLLYHHVDTVRTFEACTSISARQGFDIAYPGDVRFTAPTVRIDRGFSVEVGARFSVLTEVP